MSIVRTLQDDEQRWRRDRRSVGGGLLRIGSIVWQFCDNAGLCQRRSGQGAVGLRLMLGFVSSRGLAGVIPPCQMRQEQHGGEVGARLYRIGVRLSRGNEKVRLFRPAEAGTRPRIRPPRTGSRAASATHDHWQPFGYAQDRQRTQRTATSGRDSEIAPTADRQWEGSPEPDFRPSESLLRSLRIAPMQASGVPCSGPSGHQPEASIAGFRVQACR